MQQQVISFYDARATERSAACPNPEMQSITANRVVEDTPERVVMDVRYYWVDWSQATDIAGGSVTTCRDWSEFVFFARTSGGWLEAQSMLGSQRRV